MVNGTKYVVVNYGMGNLQSVVNALKFLGLPAVISDRKEDVASADALILPGVGAFGEAMRNLARLGLIDALNEQVVEKKKPFLGICLGMQLVAADSEEHGMNKGLGWIPGRVRRIPTDLPLPHIGWNDVEIVKRAPLFSKLKDDTNFYFVHSFYFDCDPSYVSSYCAYGVKITASVQKDNIFATQFHPEKSQRNGLRLLRAFSDYAGTKGRS